MCMFSPFSPSICFLSPQCWHTMLTKQCVILVFACFVNLSSSILQASGWAYLCVQLSHQKPRSKQYILCNIYRTPNELVDDINTFTNELSSFLVKLNNLKHSAYLCGDYNIDLLKVKMNKHYCNYFDDVSKNYTSNSFI